MRSAATQYPRKPLVCHIMWPFKWIRERGRYRSSVSLQTLIGPFYTFSFFGLTGFQCMTCTILCAIMHTSTTLHEPKTSKILIPSPAWFQGALDAPHRHLKVAGLHRMVSPFHGSPVHLSKGSAKFKSTRNNQNLLERFWWCLETL